VAAGMNSRANALAFTTYEAPLAGHLLSVLPEPTGTMSWVSGEDGLVGWGETARFAPSGPDRFEQAHQWWARIAESAEVRDEVGLRGTGPVAFASMAFDEHSAESAVVVPKVVVGQRDGVAWITTAGEQLPPRRRIGRPGAVRYSSGLVGIDGHLRAVAAAVARIRSGELEKVVLARDLVATAAAHIDERYVLMRLAAANPRCWIFAVDGLVGATPELLLQLDRETVTSRVLAGTVWRNSNNDDHGTLARQLRSSAKNLAEHGFAVTSMAETLAPHCSSLEAPASPSVLHLSDLLHFATDVRGRLATGLSLLQLAAHVHPTAAVCGTPRSAAMRAIADLEKMPRGGYAGPVGWIDARGDGEFGLALRCAQLDGRSARLFAGGGVVAGSHPEIELAETRAKLRPMQAALETRPAPRRTKPAGTAEGQK
jgi:menaquinone-specific isochorismate synthase